MNLICSGIVRGGPVTRESCLMAGVSKGSLQECASERLCVPLAAYRAYRRVVVVTFTASGEKVLGEGTYHSR